MKPDDLGCSGLPAMARCDAELPDNPQCAPNYHFGMLLGVEDFRAEQGFHVGRLRRHQRTLHGAGVVWGLKVTFDATDFELRVGPGYAIDALGRDLLIEVAQCVSLPLWWLEHRGEDAYHDIATPDDATLDLDLVICHATCLGSPVPAIAEPCAGDAADVAYSRICEIARLALVRAPTAGDAPDDAPEPAPAAAPDALPFHLLQMWLGRVGPRRDAEGKVLAADQWLIDAYNALKLLAPVEQASARAALLRELLARAAAETAPSAYDADEHDLCLPLARLRGVHLKLEPGGWRATVDSVEMGVREVLLPSAVLQDLLLAEPPAQPAAAGPVVVGGGATLANGDSEVDLVFSQLLAPASVTPAAFAISEFDATLGWQPFTPSAVDYDETDPAQPTVKLVLDRAATGALVRVSVSGAGAAPLLGRQLIPAGAVDAQGDGHTFSTSIFRG